MREWLIDQLVELCRPYWDNGLPDHLRQSEVEGSGFVRGAMLRAARMTVKMNTEFGVFQILGIKIAQQTTRAWRPRKRLLMEDISIAFHAIENANSRHPVPRQHVERFTLLVTQYLAGEDDRVQVELPAAISRYLEERQPPPD